MAIFLLFHLWVWMKITTNSLSLFLLAWRRFILKCDKLFSIKHLFRWILFYPLKNWLLLFQNVDKTSNVKCFPFLRMIGFERKKYFFFIHKQHSMNSNVQLNILMLWNWFSFSFISIHRIIEQRLIFMNNRMTKEIDSQWKSVKRSMVITPSE